MLGDLHRNHRQLDDFPGALDPAASQVRPAIGTVLHHVLHPMGRCHAPAGEAVASLLAGLLLRWRLAARTGLEAGHSGRAARFRLAFQFGNPPLQSAASPAGICSPSISCACSVGAIDERHENIADRRWSGPTSGIRDPSI